ncbi:MAG: hypothetical protein AAB304_03115 [Pseudomonadota bacterium]
MAATGHNRCIIPLKPKNLSAMHTRGAAAHSPYRAATLAIQLFLA